MTQQKKKYNPYLKPFKNVFILSLIIFSVWMLFFDSNSWFFHNDLNNDIEKLEQEKEHYNTEIKKDNKEIKKLTSEKGIEKYGRETFNMKKENEDIYIIEYEDSVKLKKKDD